MQYRHREQWERFATAWAAVQVIAVLGSFGGHALTQAARAHYCADLQRQMQVDHRLAERVDAAVAHDTGWRERWCQSMEQSTQRREARERATGVSEELADFVKWREHDHRERERQHIRSTPNRTGPSAELRHLRDQDRTRRPAPRSPQQAAVDRERRRRRL